MMQILRYSFSYLLSRCSWCALVGQCLLSLSVISVDIGDGRGAQAAASYWDVPPAASVYSEMKSSMPAHSTQAVELLRFITAYKKGVEALVDITPYSALLKASADTDGELTFFAFIDTWVGNNTPTTRPAMYMTSSKCFEVSQEEPAPGGGGEQGNGWQIDADLVFWPPVGKVDTRPRESITISSGYYGSYSFGAITVHSGTVAASGTQVELQSGTDLTGTIDAEVYPCPGGSSDIQQGVKMGQLARQLQELGESSESTESIIDQVHQEIQGEAMRYLKVLSVDFQKRYVQVSFNHDDIKMEVGMPVYYETSDIILSDDSGNRTESPPGMTVAGNIAQIEGDTAMIQMSGLCLPSELHLQVPRLKMPKARDAFLVARKLADSLRSFSQEHRVQRDVSLLARRRNQRYHKMTDRSDVDDGAQVFKPFLVAPDVNHRFNPMPILGQINLGAVEKNGIACASNIFSFLQKAEHSTFLGRREANKNKENGLPLPFGLDTSQRLIKSAKVSPSLSVKSHSVRGAAFATAERLLRKAGSIQQGGITRPRDANLKDGDKVCILARHAQGRVFERKFDIPTVFPANSNTLENGTATPGDDHVLLQLAVTGHGWSGSTEQCGEYCHAIYHVIVNGQYAFNLTQWRDDCARNPINSQYGTWETARDGWCPGSVEPGLYVDVTRWMKHGENQIAVDVTVYSGKTGGYEPYTNYGGFVGGNNAILVVGATLFVYDGVAVAAVKDQVKAFTAAEKALREGCSVPSALNPPAEAKPDFAFSLLQQRESIAKDLRNASMKAANRKTQALRESRASETSFERYDFERRAPWYLYKEGRQSNKKIMSKATSVPVFKDALIQMNSREIRIKVNKKGIPHEWGTAAMHLRLQRPGADSRTDLEGLEMDNWDRLGSLGLVFEETAKSTLEKTSMVKLHPSLGHKLLKHLQLL